MGAGWREVQTAVMVEGGSAGRLPMTGMALASEMVAVDAAAEAAAPNLNGDGGGGGGGGGGVARPCVQTSASVACSSMLPVYFL